MDERVTTERRAPRRALTYVVTGLQWIAALALFALMACQFSDVVARYVLGSPIPGGQDIIGLALALTIFIAMPIVTWQRAHITVPIFEQHFKGWFRYVVRLFAILATGAAFLAIAYGLYRRGHMGLTYGIVTEDTEMPLAPIWYGLSGLALLAVILLLEPLWRYLSGGGDPSGDADPTSRLGGRS